MSRSARWIVSGFILLFIWMILSGWSTATSSQRVGTAIVAGVMLTLAIGLMAPSGRLAFRIVAGVISIAYAVYFGTQVWRLFRGEAQTLAMGTPSAVMAGLGFVVFGIPALVFALSGQLVGIARVFRSRTPGGSESR